MPKHAKRLHERIQELVGVSRSELTVAACLFAISCSTLLYRWIAEPEDPLHTALYERIRFVIDSTAKARDSLGAMMGPRLDTDTLALPIDIKAPSPYKRKIPPKKPINVANASAEMLQKVPGIGPSMASRIIDYRKQHPLLRMEQLRHVKGIGPKLYQKITPYLCIERAAPNVQPTRKH